MPIKITKISGPTQREIRVVCPECKIPLSRNVPINSKKGKDRCGICGTTFTWEEVNEPKGD